MSKLTNDELWLAVLLPFVPVYTFTLTWLAFG
jgi:hypothetical protein